MLVGLDGGAGPGAAPRTLDEALEAYALDRMARIGPEDELAVQVVLEVLAAFFCPEHAELIGGERAGSAGSGFAARSMLRGLHASMHLFPYSCVVSQGVISRFAAEVRALASWSVDAGLCHAEELPPFRAGYRRALASFREHRQLQNEIEATSLAWSSSDDGELLQGRFLVDRVDALGLSALIPHSGERRRVLLTSRARRFFAPGQSVSLAMVRGAQGWRPVGASLPARADWLEHRFEELRALAWPTPLRTLRARPREGHS